jgi:acid phosphatase type 7
MNSTKHRWFMPSLLTTIGGISIVALCSNISNCALFLLHGHLGAIDDQEDLHTIPTLLSAVDESTGKYIYALTNPLYDRLKGAVFEEYDQLDLIKAPVVHLSDNTIEPRGALTLSWTLGRDRNGQPVVQDDDVILLYCDDEFSRSHGVSEKMYIDAATIGQAKASTKKHRQDGDSTSQLTMWHFPSFPVLRHDVCQFHLFKARPRKRFALLAKTELLKIHNGRSTPTAIHLALGNSVDEMVVQFKTGVNRGTPIVRYGTVEDSWGWNTTGTTHTYTAQDMCQSPATEEEAGKFQSPGQLHVVRLKHLAPNTTIYYQVGIEHVGMTTWSQSYSFISPPEVALDSMPISYVVYGDQGCPSDGWGQGGVWTAAMAEREATLLVPIRAVHHFGDLSYARGAAHIWDEWLNMISSFATRVPLMIAVGNHEYDHTKGGENGKDPSGVPTTDGYQPKWRRFGKVFGKDSGGECGVPTANLFTMPNGTNSNGVFWYSYKFGNVHTTVISSEHDMSPGSRQYRWLEDDLKSVNRASTPWVVLELHRPLYESQISPKNNLVGKAMRDRVEDLLLKYKVDIVLAGHYHSYQRSCGGLYKGKCDSGGPTYVTIGSAGAMLDSMPITPGNRWTAKAILHVWGYGRITIMNATALHFEFVRAGPKSNLDAGKVLDDVWLMKNHHDLETASEE